MTANTAAAAILRPIIEQLPATKTNRDTREREAMAAAAGVLEHGRQPLPAIGRVYHRHG